MSDSLLLFSILVNNALIAFIAISSIRKFSKVDSCINLVKDDVTTLGIGVVECKKLEERLDKLESQTGKLTSAVGIRTMTNL